jgi:hypothetical protein
MRPVAAEDSSDARAKAEHHRQAMEQRRNVEITLFGALVTSQIALMALAASQAQKTSAHVTARFSGVVGIVLLLTYLAMCLRIEVLNRIDRAIYAKWETGSSIQEGNRAFILRSWAAWPMVPAVIITGVLVWSTMSLGW